LLAYIISYNRRITVKKLGSSYKTIKCHRLTRAGNYRLPVWRWPDRTGNSLRNLFHGILAKESRTDLHIDFNCVFIEIVPNKKKCLSRDTEFLFSASIHFPILISRCNLRDLHKFVFQYNKRYIFTNLNTEGFNTLCRRSIQSTHEKSRTFVSKTFLNRILSRENDRHMKCVSVYQQNLAF